MPIVLPPRPPPQVNKAPQQASSSATASNESAIPTASSLPPAPTTKRKLGEAASQSPAKKQKGIDGAHLPPKPRVNNRFNGPGLSPGKLASQWHGSGLSLPPKPQWMNTSILGAHLPPKPPQSERGRNLSGNPQLTATPNINYPLPAKPVSNSTPNRNYVPNWNPTSGWSVTPDTNLTASPNAGHADNAAYSNSLTDANISFYQSPIIASNTTARPINTPDLRNNAYPNGAPFPKNTSTLSNTINPHVLTNSGNTGPLHDSGHGSNTAYSNSPVFQKNVALMRNAISQDNALYNSGTIYQDNTTIQSNTAYSSNAPYQNNTASSNSTFKKDTARPSAVKEQKLTSGSQNHYEPGSNMPEGLGFATGKEPKKRVRKSRKKVTQQYQPPPIQPQGYRQAPIDLTQDTISPVQSLMGHIQSSHQTQPPDQSQSPCLSLYQSGYLTPPPSSDHAPSQPSGSALQSLVGQIQAPAEQPPKRANENVQNSNPYSYTTENVPYLKNRKSTPASATDNPLNISFGSSAHIAPQTVRASSQSTLQDNTAHFRDNAAYFKNLATEVSNTSKAGTTKRRRPYANAVSSSPPPANNVLTSTVYNPPARPTYTASPTPTYRQANTRNSLAQPQQENRPDFRTYRGGCLDYLPGSATPRGYAGDPSRREKPIDEPIFILQGPPPGYGPTATQGAPRPPSPPPVQVVDEKEEDEDKGLDIGERWARRKEKEAREGTKKQAEEIAITRTFWPFLHMVEFGSVAQMSDIIVD